MRPLHWLNAVFNADAMRSRAAFLLHRFDHLVRQPLFYAVISLGPALLLGLRTGLSVLVILMFAIPAVAAGLFVAYRVIHYVPYAVVRVTMLFVLCWSFPMIFSGMAIVLNFNLPLKMPWEVIIAGLALFGILVALGMRRAKSTDWGSDGAWIRRFANADTMRIYEPEPQLDTSDLGTTAAMAATGYLILLLAPLLFDQPISLAKPLLAGLAAALLHVCGRIAYRDIGSLAEAVRQLRTIEAASSHRFIFGNIEALQRDRQAHWLGRLLVRKNLQLHPVYGTSRQ
jgi:hypothetical protein